MRLEDVTILSSISPVQIRKTPSALTVEALAQLFADKEFVQWIKYLRKHNSGDENKFESIHQFIDKDLLSISEEPIFYAFQAFPEQLLNKYGMHKNLSINIGLLTFFNAMIDLEDYEMFIKHDIEFIATKKAISNRLWELPYEACALVIPYSTKVSELRKYIDEHAEEIEKKMDTALFKDTFLQKVHEKTELASEIVHLRDEKGMTFPKISDLLTEKYPNDSVLSDEVQIRTLYHRYKNDYWKLPKISKINH